MYMLLAVLIETDFKRKNIWRDCRIYFAWIILLKIFFVSEIIYIAFACIHCFCSVFIKVHRNAWTELNPTQLSIAQLKWYSWFLQIFSLHPHCNTLFAQCPTRIMSRFTENILGVKQHRLVFGCHGDFLAAESVVQSCF